MIQYIYRGTTKVLGYIWDILKWPWQGTAKVLGYIWDILKWLWQNVDCCIRYIVQKIGQFGVWCWQYRCIRCICWPVQKIWQFGVWCFNWLRPGSYDRSFSGIPCSCFILRTLLCVCILLVLLFIFCTRTEAGRNIRYRLFSSNGSQPLISDGSDKGRRCQILDDKWKNELSKYTRINLRPAGESCNYLCTEIRRQLRNVDFVESNWDIIVVVTLKVMRVQSDAESALERVGHNTEQEDNVILLIFHKVAGGKTVEDVTSIMYQNPDVKKTLHVPFTS